MPAARPRAVLIDGYNLLHAVPRFAPRGADLAPRREALESWLAGEARRRGAPEVVLVWDGRAGSRAGSAPAPLTVLYTPAGLTADERILSLCRGPYARRADSTWVVSSDRGIQAPARQLGFHVLGAMTFYRRWSAAGRSAPPEPGEKPGRPTSAEVDELLDAFLEDRGDRPDDGR